MSSLMISFRVTFIPLNDTLIKSAPILLVFFILIKHVLKRLISSLHASGLS